MTMWLCVQIIALQSECAELSGNLVNSLPLQAHIGKEGDKDKERIKEKERK
jgi:hypothetical protein